MNAPDRMGYVVDGLDAAAYHATDALGASGLKLLRRSPAHYYGQAVDPLRPTKKPSPAMAAGTLAHCAILEPDKLADRYVVRPDGLDGRTKEGKAWLAAVPAGVEAITAEQMATAQRQSAAVRSLQDVAPLLDRGRAEVSAFWTDPRTGAQCKCRPDCAAPAGDGVVLLDVKTANDASPDGFARAVWNFGYHLQDAWYRDGYERASRVHVVGFVFLVVESDYPHCAAAYTLDDETLRFARDDNARLLDLYAECRRAGQWPGYPASVGVLSLPAWARTQPTIETE